MNRNKIIKLTLLYGSFARNDEKGESDVDLMVVSDGNLEQFYSDLSKLESQFSREINPTVYSSSEFRRKILAKNSFVLNVLKQPYRVLKGDLREFKKAAV